MSYGGPWSAVCRGSLSNGTACSQRDQCARYIYHMTLEASGRNIVVPVLTSEKRSFPCRLFVTSDIQPEWWWEMDYVTVTPCRG